MQYQNKEINKSLIYKFSIMSNLTIKKVSEFLNGKIDYENLDYDVNVEMNDFGYYEPFFSYKTDDLLTAKIYKTLYDTISETIDENAIEIMEIFENDLAPYDYIDYGNELIIDNHFYRDLIDYLMKKYNFYDFINYDIFADYSYDVE